MQEALTYKLETAYFLSQPNPITLDQNPLFLSRLGLGDKHANERNDAAAEVGGKLSRDTTFILEATFPQNLVRRSLGTFQYLRGNGAGVSAYGQSLFFLPPQGIEIFCS